MSRVIENIDGLRDRVSYNPDTGHLFWKAIVGSPDLSPHQVTWNKRFAGERCFNTKNGHGYLRGNIWGEPHMAHRVAWAIFHGESPAGDIDHINGDRSDNRIENLRVVSRAENCRNATISKSNTSGVTGVSWDKGNGKWRSSIRVDGELFLLGLYPRFEDAVEVRKRAEEKHGFHEGHGKPKLGGQE